MAYDTDSERELDVRCKILYDLTKEYVENASRATSRLFYWAYHETWMLMAFPKVLASKKAYNLFFEKYKEDIREYGWFSGKIEDCREDNKKRTFMHEHLTTSEDFKRELIYLYENDSLNIDKIKTLLLQQRVCWVTREEDDRLNAMGYRDHRADPLQAYKECGIEIYEAEKEDLGNVMIPSVSLVKTPKIKGLSEGQKVEAGLSIKLLERIREVVSIKLSDFNFHYCMSYIQIWKKSWNNRGKTSVHIELTTNSKHGFYNLVGNDALSITFRLHNEVSSRGLFPQIPKSKKYMVKEYSFLNENLDRSINELVDDIKKIILIDEQQIDLAHQKLINKKGYN